jgi:flagellar L-ring protein FlgH
MSRQRRGMPAAVILLSVVAWVDFGARAWASKAKPDSEQLRAQYIARMQQGAAPQLTTTLGSLYASNAALADMASDYKARHLDDMVTLLVSETTAASSTGDVDSERTFSTTSAITGVAGGVSTASVNPLLAANSARALKGKGETSAGSTVNATLAARVIAVLPNGNMVVEAERRILINSQHETMVVRGVLRPGDVSPSNTAPAAALADLEIELKGKGVVSDGLNRTNPILRKILWVIGF